MTFTVPRWLLALLALIVLGGVGAALVWGFPDAGSNQIALASVLVAGVVGVASPVVVSASAASRQETELAAAESRLRLQLAHDRLVADLNEARKLLDDAVDHGEAALSALSEAQSCLRVPDFAEAEKRLDGASEAIGILGYKNRRLMLRTGRFDDLPILLDGWADDLRRLLGGLHDASAQSRALDDPTYQERVLAIARAQAAVIDQATDAVGVKLTTEPTLSGDDVAAILRSREKDATEKRRPLSPD